MNALDLYQPLRQRLAKIRYRRRKHSLHSLTFVIGEVDAFAAHAASARARSSDRLLRRRAVLGYVEAIKASANLRV